MARRGRRTSLSAPQRFGGDWTEKKLALLKDYLHAFTTALKDKPSPARRFELWYIDAFAGSGTRSDPEPPSATGATGSERPPALFVDAEESDGNRLRAGSARIALASQPPFDRFLFVDKERRNCDALRALVKRSMVDEQRATIVHGDANDVLANRCRDRWNDRRAVVFLDPFAISVRWSTLEAIAGTQAMDTWILFPLMATNRLLTRDGQVPRSWSAKLDELLGTRAWSDRVYTRVGKGLFGQEELIKSRADAIGRFFLERLKTIFAGVSPHPRILTNSGGSPLFMLVFAAANPKGAPIALRIANHLLERDDI